MSRRDVQRVVAELAALFPAGSVTPTTVALYVQALEDLPIRALDGAARELIATRTSPYLPTVGEIRMTACRQVIGAPSEVEALEVANEYAGRDHGGSRPHRCVLRALNAVGGKYAWRTTENPTVLRSQFLAAYRDVLASETQQESLRGIARPTANELEEVVT